MKILILLLLLITQYANADSIKKCSDKIQMKFSENITDENGVRISGGSIESLISYDIDNIESIMIRHFDYRNKEKKDICDLKNIKILPPRFYVKFEPPYNIHKITVVPPRYIGRMDALGSERNYIVIVAKTVNGKIIQYYKIFNFMIY